MSEDADQVEAAHAHFAEQVRARAKRRSLPLRTLAEEIEVSEVSLHRWLSGERSPQLEVVVRLATALGCRPRDLLP